ncbi:MAG: VOC family protein [Nitrospiria bacterium]
MTNHFKKKGSFSWNELMTTDVDQAKAFYAGLFGWTTEDWPMNEMNYAVIKNGDEDIGGIMPIPEEAKGAPPNWGAYITVEDVDSSAAKAKALGASIIVPPTDIPKVGRFCLFQDPQGATLSMITYAECQE